MTDALEPGKKTPRVLIVDDDPGVLKLLADRCVGMGLRVQTAVNGIQALIMARQDPPDVLIVDVHMPELDGLSLCARLLQPDRKNMEIIVVSGYADPETCERCESFGAIYARKGPDLWNMVQSAIGEILPGATLKFEDAQAPTHPVKVRERPLILVIDDDPDVGEFLVSRLRKVGADALFTTDGIKGFRIARRENPSVIISDYFMPEADVNFLLWRLRSTPATERTPVIVMTALQLDPATEARLLRGDGGGQGVAAIFKKPLDVNELFRALQKYCALEYDSDVAGR